VRKTDLDRYLEERRALINEALKKSLPPRDVPPQKLHQAMHYSLFAGGKRLRPILVLAAGEALGSPLEPLLPAACAVELLHTYTLIHDDLPAMDDDDYRRGLPTCHKVFGEAVAILAGDALLTQAFLILSQAGYPPERVVRAVKELALAAGSLGLVGGQAVDLEAEGQEVPLETVDFIYRNKTASLIRASLLLGGILGGGGEEQLQILSEYGQNLGMAFQITDDLLDIEGDFHQLGKETGRDILRKKATYPALLGVEGAKEKAREYCQRARHLALALGPPAEPLALMAEYVLSRRS